MNWNLKRWREDVARLEEALIVKAVFQALSKLIRNKAPDPDCFSFAFSSLVGIFFFKLKEKKRFWNFF